MTDYDNLRELAQAVPDPDDWYAGDPEAMYVVTGDAAEFLGAVSPALVLALLDELQAAKRVAWDEGFLDRHLNTHRRDDNPYLPWKYE